MTIAEQTAKLVDSLPPDKAQTVLDFARFLADATTTADDQEWDRRLDTAHERPEFREFIATVEREIAEGLDTPLDPDRL